MDARTRHIHDGSVLDMATLKKRFDLGEPGDRADAAYEAYFAPDGKTVVRPNLFISHNSDPITAVYSRCTTGGTGGVGDKVVARLWDLETGALLATFGDCRHAVYSPDGKTLATDDYYGNIRLWDVPPRKPTRAILGLSTALWAVLLLALNFGGRLIGWTVPCGFGRGFRSAPTPATRSP
jgi:WD40 repeat protein